MRQADYTGTILDNKYEVIDLIGEGGMGAVYRGRHIAIGKPVAIKFLHAGLAKNEEVVKRFYREAQAAAAIRHSSIIDVVDLGVSLEGEPYLVMEFLEGIGLSDYLRRKGHLSLPAACGIIEPALQALSAAHARGIVHRDLKPDNLFLVHRTGESFGVKLIDFGISKFLDAPDQTQLTQDGSMLGTPAYMSPEQARGQKDVDHRTDLYAIGVILYQMLTGETPFTGVSYSELLLNMLTTEPRDPVEVNPEFPAPARGIVQRALQKDPELRFQSAEEMLGAIRALTATDDLQKHMTMLAEEWDGETIHAGSSADVGAENSRVAQGIYTNMLQRRRGPSTGRSRQQTAQLLLSRGTRAIVTSVGLVVRGSRTLIGAVAGAAWPRRAARAAALGVRRIAGHPRRIVPFSVFGAVAVAAVSLPLLCSHGHPKVTITLEGVPEEASVFFGDEEMENNPFHVEKTETASTLRVEAAGKKPFTTRVVPKQDRVVTVTLRNQPPTESPKRRATEPLEPRPGASEEAAPASKAETNEKSGEKDRVKSKRRRFRVKWPLKRNRKGPESADE